METKDVHIQRLQEQIEKLLQEDKENHGQPSSSLPIETARTANNGQTEEVKEALDEPRDNPVKSQQDTACEALSFLVDELELGPISDQ